MFPWKQLVINYTLIIPFHTLVYRAWRSYTWWCLYKILQFACHWYHILPFVFSSFIRRETKDPHVCIWACQAEHNDCCNHGFYSFSYQWIPQLLPKLAFDNAKWCQKSETYRVIISHYGMWLLTIQLTTVNWLLVVTLTSHRYRLPRLSSPGMEQQVVLIARVCALTTQR